MKKISKNKFLIIIATVASLLFGLLLAACDTEDKPDIGNAAILETMEIRTVPELTPSAMVTAQPMETFIPYGEFTMDKMYVLVNVEYMNVMAEPNFESDVAGQILFGAYVGGEACEAWKMESYRQYIEGTAVPIDESVKWLKTAHEGTEGYIFCGVTEAGEKYVYDGDATALPLELSHYIGLIIETYTVWINAEYINIMLKPDFESEVIGQIPYGTCIPGDVCDAWRKAIYEQFEVENDEQIDENVKWLHMSYEGIVGFIFCGVTEDGESYVVYGEQALGE